MIAKFVIKNFLKDEKKIIYFIGISWIIINFFLLLEGVEYFFLSSLALLLFFIALKRINLIFFVVILLTPLSINLSDIIKDIDRLDLSLFTEPFLFLILVFLVFDYFLKNRKIDESFLTKVILIQLLWFFITSLTSELPIVSIKATIARAWFVFPIYLLGIDLFKNYKHIKLFLILHVSTLIIVIVYSTINLTKTSLLDSNSAHLVMKPFYNDHTAYGAIIALLAPIFMLLPFSKKIQPLYKIVIFFIFLILILALVLSYSRASWIGFVFALGVMFLILLRIRFIYIFFISIILGAFVWAFWFEILDNLSKNTQDSSSDISKHIESITNIKTDASNTERLNRWYCAIEMFKERPFLGWGPNTYQFEYAPYQLMEMRTIISTNEGDIGNAHSEYLTPLVEQGVIGLLIMIVLVGAIISQGLNVYYRARDQEVRLLALGITLGFITYFIHGLLNNFLDTDKLAIPFFALAAVLVSLEKYHLSSELKDDNNQKSDVSSSV